MDFIIDAIVEWLKGLLVDGIMGNLDGLFNNVNEQVGEIAVQVGTTPADWNAGVFSMIRQLSETVVLPIAGIILTFVATYELIQMLIDRNNLHDVDTWMFFKWTFKTFVAVMILANTFNIALAVFDVSQHVIQQSAGIIQNGTEITPDVMDSLRTELEAMDVGPLLGLWLQSFLVQLTMIALNIVIFVIVYGRMIERRLLISTKPVSAKSFASIKTGKHGLSLMKLKQEQNVFALLKSQIVSVAKRVTSFIRERNSAGKPLLDNGSMPEFVNYVGVKKPICMRFTLYGT